MEILYYIIMGLLIALAALLIIGKLCTYLRYDEPLVDIHETEEDRIKRYERKRNRQRKRERFTSPSTADGKTIFGFPMDDL
ncbi:MAG: hypothetical protein J6129_06110, partial [Bacteroidaceae bacterium]|nr:hypothetical protein [Bacteroidaceae bacterium]